MRGITALYFSNIHFALFLFCQLLENQSRYKGNEKNLSLNNTENYTDEELANFSIDELTELYGIEEELLTYEQMDEVVTRIKEGLEDSLPNKEKSEKIHYIIREEYGILNAIAYKRGLLIKEEHVWK